MKPTKEEMLKNLLDYLDKNPDDDSIFVVDKTLTSGIMKFTDENGFVLIVQCKDENGQLTFPDYYVEE